MEATLVTPVYWGVINTIRVVCAAAYVKAKYESKGQEPGGLSGRTARR